MNAEVGCLEWWLLEAGVDGEGGRDASLVARARRGDPSAFDEIVRRYQKRVYNLAYRMLRRHEDAEDVTQEAFLRAFESLPRLRKESAIGVWVCRIAANLCVSWLRSKRRGAEVTLDPGAIPAREISGEDAVSRDLIRRTREAVAQLPPKYRLAVVAHYFEGRSYEEAARVIGVRVRTLKTRLYRARKMLRDLLGRAIIHEEETGP